MTLLPPSATPQERALEATMARVGDVNAEVIGQLWNPSSCPLALLPWLAWALAVPEWDPAWSEDTKRAVVALTPQLHRRAGTGWAVRTALAAAGFGAVTLVEGRPPVRYDGTHRYNGQVTYGGSTWAAFEVHLEPENSEISAAESARLRRLVDAWKPARCRLDVIGLQLGEAVDVLELADAADLDAHHVNNDVWPGLPRYDGTYAYDGGITYAVPRDVLELVVEVGP